MTALEYIIEIHELGSGRFWSIEKPKEPASKSEIRRWFKNKAIHINGKAVSAEDILDEPLESVVLFPNSNKKRITIK